MPMFTLGKLNRFDNFRLDSHQAMEMILNFVLFLFQRV